jgi:hypothetical protein
MEIGNKKRLVGMLWFSGRGEKLLLLEIATLEDSKGDVLVTVFGSENIINLHISEEKLCTYFVGFDLNDNNESEYRLRELVSVLIDVIPEFAFGFHEGQNTSNTRLVTKIADAAKAIYKIKGFMDTKEIYFNGGELKDDIEDKYLRRGEFGELILHLLLRDFHRTVPLLSKIYFKDSMGHAVHGFDAVHIEPSSKTLWLGESKIYTEGKNGVSALIKDIEEHFKKDYLHEEFTLVSKKVKHLDEVPEKEYWLRLLGKSTKLSEQLKAINIPLLCTYTSDNFSKYSDESLNEFIKDYETEVRKLEKHFNDNNTHKLKTKLNIILLLFPVKSKKELVENLHKKLYLMQQLGG